MRRLLLPLIVVMLVATACAQPVEHEVDCPQVAVGEQVITNGAPVATSSEWGYILDTVRWTPGPGITVVDWRLGGDLDNDALQAVVQGEEAGMSSLVVDYTQLSREGVGPVRTVTERCEIRVVEAPDFDLSGTWSVQRDLGDTVCAGGPTEDDAEITITQDSSGNLLVEGINAGYAPWEGAIDVDMVSFGGLRDEPQANGGGTTESSFAIEVTSRSRMSGTETWSWTDDTSSCEATTEVSFRRS